METIGQIVVAVLAGGLYGAIGYGLTQLLYKEDPTCPPLIIFWPLLLAGFLLGVLLQIIGWLIYSIAWLGYTIRDCDCWFDRLYDPLSKIGDLKDKNDK